MDKDFDLCEVEQKHEDNIEYSKQDMMPDELILGLTEIFKILGDPTRVRILDILAKRELCVCDIASILNMGQSAVSHQLRLLRGARLVKFRRDGKEAFYSLDDEHVVCLIKQGIEHVKHDERRGRNV